MNDIGILPGLTGGELFFYPRFERVRDGGKLRADIKRVGSRETGYSVTMRIRCSNGRCSLTSRTVFELISYELICQGFESRTTLVISSKGTSPILNLGTLMRIKLSQLGLSTRES
jgi:hypothetical protein